MPPDPIPIANPRPEEALYPGRVRRLRPEGLACAGRDRIGSRHQLASGHADGDRTLMTFRESPTAWKGPFRQAYVPLSVSTRFTSPDQPNPAPVTPCGPSCARCGRDQQCELLVITFQPTSFPQLLKFA